MFSPDSFVNPSLPPLSREIDAILTQMIASGFALEAPTFPEKVILGGGKHAAVPSKREWSPAAIVKEPGQAAELR